MTRLGETNNGVLVAGDTIDMTMHVASAVYNIVTYPLLLPGLGPVAVYYITL